MKQAKHYVKLKKSGTTRRWRTWHQRFGLITALFLLVMLLTGVLLNHSSHLGLHNRKIENNWLLNLYQVPAPRHRLSIASDNNPTLFITDNLLWLGKQKLLEAQQNLISAAFYQTHIIAIDQSQLYLLTPEGDLLETQNRSTGLPENLAALAIETSPALSKACLRTAAGSYCSEDELISWQAVADNSITWSEPQNFAENHPAAQQARSSHLTMLQLMQDIHSGRIFGNWAVWFWDLIALLLLLVIIMGLRIWWIQPKP